MNRFSKILVTTALSIFSAAVVNAQVVASDSVLQNRNAKSIRMTLHTDVSTFPMQSSI